MSTPNSSEILRRRAERGEPAATARAAVNRHQVLMATDAAVRKDDERVRIEEYRRLLRARSNRLGYRTLRCAEPGEPHVGVVIEGDASPGRRPVDDVVGRRSERDAGTERDLTLLAGAQVADDQRPLVQHVGAAHNRHVGEAASPPIQCRADPVRDPPFLARGQIHAIEVRWPVATQDGYERASTACREGDPLRPIPPQRPRYPAYGIAAVAEDPKPTREVADEEAVSGHERAMVAGTARRDAHRGTDTRGQQNAKRHCLDRFPHENSAYAWDETQPDAHHVQLKYRLTALLTKMGRARAKANAAPRLAPLPR